MKAANHSARPFFSPNDDVVVLVRRLSAAEAALEHTLGSDLDAVIDASGNAHLLRQAQVALRQSESRFRTLIEKSSDVITLLAADGTVLYNSPSVTSVLGYASAELVGRSVFRFFHPDEHAGAVEVLTALRAVARKSITVSLRYRHKDGTYRWLEGTGTNLLDEPGVNAVVLNYRDVTGRRQAETALRESNEKFLQLADNITDAFWIRSPDLSEVQYISPAFEQIWGRSVASLLANPQEWKDFIFADDRARVLRAFAALSGPASRLDIEYRIVRPDGEIRWVRVRGFQVRNATDQLIRHIGIVTDITEWRHTMEALRTSETEFRSLAEAMPQIVWITRPDGWNVYFNKKWMEYTGLTLAESNGHGWNKPFHPDDRERALAAWQQAIATGGIYSLECRLRRADGIYRWWLIRGVPVSDVSGKILQWFGTCTDIHELKLAEENLRQSEALLRIAGRTAQLGGWAVDLPGNHITWSDGVCAILEVPPGTVPGLDQALSYYAPHSRATISQALAACGQQGTAFDLELEVITAKGHGVWVRCTGEARRNAAGVVTGAQGAFQDITGRKRLEDQFRQAQKMEAIGTLAGGIAHDFNNILAAISGYTELSTMTLQENPEVRGYLEATMRAAGRATDLVRQILTFSRQQPQERRPIQLAPIVTETIALLRATLPATIEFDTAFATDAPIVFADASQIHQILMNLGTNAWHAMKDHPGRLQVKLERCVVDAVMAAGQARLRPGVYAHVSVSDTGCGMDLATQRRIFEPFFTTKPVGEGTGLGLSVVHGIMTDHDGAITVYSQPGKGTVFHLYFPAHLGAAAVPVLAAAPVARGHGERILFIDDEQFLAELGQETLSSLGYEVESSTHPAAALALVRADPHRFALVLTDLTMPGMTGLALAGQLHQIRPGLPIILMTGYSATVTSDRAKAFGIHELLLKPMSLHALGTAVQAALAATALP